MDEVELKLEVAPEAAEALETADFLTGAPDRVEQRSVYFDTPGETLSKAGFSLRIRQANGARVQTVKAVGARAAGLFARSEWESAVADDTPCLDETTPVRALVGEAADDIAPRFEVHVTRRIWTVRDEAASIELVVDRGTVVAGDRRAALSEIELELKEGDPAALFALARRIDAVAPVRLGVLSKADRGYRLSGEAPSAVKAEPVLLHEDMTAAQAFQQIVQLCLRQFRLNEALLQQGRAAAPLHQARVALRRLRSAFSIFKPIIGDGDAAKFREELRWLSSELGDARNLDVLMEREVPASLHDRIAAARDAAHDRVGEALASPRVRRLMIDLAEWTARGDWLAAEAGAAGRAQPATAFAVVALDRFRRKVKKDGRDLAGADDETRHRVRKDTKKLRYASEFFEALFQRKRQRLRHKHFIRALEDIQQQLGDLNDHATAPLLLKKIGIDKEPDAAALLMRHKRGKLIEAAVEAHDELVDAKRFWR